MRPYFSKMDDLGKELKPARIKRSAASSDLLREVEAGIDEQKKKVEAAGLPTEKINDRGSMTVWQRLEYLVDAGSWRSLHQACNNPLDNDEGTTNVVDGLAKIEGPLGSGYWFRQQGHGRGLVTRTIREYPASYQPCPAP